MNGLSGSTDGARFTWTNRDAALARYRAAGYQIHGVISFREHVQRGSTAQWERNWRYFARNVMSHYRNDVRYWIIDNEPEKGFGNYYPTPAETVKFTRIAFEELNNLGIQDRCMLESPPVASPEASYLRQMLDAGLGNYCHVIGFHCYGSQIEDKRIRRVWDQMATKGIRNSVPASRNAARRRTTRLQAIQAGPRRGGRIFTVSSGSPPRPSVTSMLSLQPGPVACQPAGVGAWRRSTRAAPTTRRGNRFSMRCATAGPRRSRSATAGSNRRRTAREPG